MPCLPHIQRQGKSFLILQRWISSRRALVPTHTCTNTHTHTQTFSLSLLYTHTHTNLLTLLHTRAHTHTHAYTLTHSLTHSLAHSLMLFHTHSIFCTITHSLVYSLTLLPTYSLSFTHSCTHTHSHSLSPWPFTCFSKDWKYHKKLLILGLLAFTKLCYSFLDSLPVTCQFLYESCCINLPFSALLNFLFTFPNEYQMYLRFEAN